MRALVNGSPPRLSLDHPTPVRKPGEARVRVRMAGICDTDLQLARGYMGYRGVLGHEFVGEVVESDDAAWRGARVVADINAGCGRCDDCRLRDGHHCAERSVLGILARDGALADELVMPERCLVRVPESVSDDRAVFAEPLAAALHVLDESGREPVLILGDGKLGLLIAHALRSAGVEVVLVGHHQEKLAHARAIGARTMLEDQIDVQRDSSSVVVEATGSAGGLDLALRLVRPRGKLVLKTTVAGKTEVDLSPIVIHELSVIGSRCGDMRRAVDALAGGRIDRTPLIAARYGLDRAEDALRHAGSRGTLKVLVGP